MTIYQTTVQEIGKDAELFKEEKILILFGKDAPDMLKDYCYNIELTNSTGDIEANMILKIDDQLYQVTAVGDKVQKNLDDLGHITIKFDGQTVAELPGTLHVEAKPYPVLKIGSQIAIG